MKKLIINPLSKNNIQAAEITDEPALILDSNNRSTLKFKWVKNKDNPNYNLEATLIYSVDGKNFQKKITKRDFQPGEYFPLELSSKETFILYDELKKHYDFLKDRNIPNHEEIYVKLNDNLELQLLNVLKNVDKKTLENLFKNFSEPELLNLNVISNTVQLLKIKEKIKNYLNDQGKNEHDWHELFKKNPWILCQLFNAPSQFFQNEFNCGGSDYTGSGAMHTDFAYWNPISKNITIIEIKRPSTPLLRALYRGVNVYALSDELTGAINQVLAQKQSLYNDNNSINKANKYQAVNINAILLIGNLNEFNNSLNDEEKRNKLVWFENFRNELKSVEIITFDELLEKIEIMLKLLEKNIDNSN